MSNYNNTIKCSISFSEDQDTFSVVHIEGKEALSELFTFTCMLYTSVAVEALSYIGKDVTISVTAQDDEKREWHGVTASLTELMKTTTGYIYKATIRPHAWWLTLTEYSQVFLSPNQSDANPGDPLKTILASACKESGLPDVNVDFTGMSEQFKRRYVCQYEESYFQFLSRWLETLGVWYGFTHHTGTDVLTLVESGNLGSLPDPVEYSENFGLDSRHGKLVYALTEQRTLVPKRVLVRDYNPERPTEEILAAAVVDPNGDGESYSNGEHLKTKAEAQLIAELRSQAFLCRKKVFQGKTTIAAMTPGKKFTLQGHSNKAFNREFFIESVSHEINNSAHLIKNLKADLGNESDKDASFYRNSIICLETETPYRPQQLTPAPRIAKVISAHVETQGSKTYAQLDEQGRYRVRMPFDISNNEDGKASCLLHMGKPYAGNNYGMHFPLPAGTEVMISFVQGNPDRPYISAAVPNPATPSKRTDATQTSMMISSLTQNELEIEDRAGSESVSIRCSSTGSTIQFGNVASGATSCCSQGVYENTGPDGSYLINVGGFAEFNTAGNHTEQILAGGYTLDALGNRDERITGKFSEFILGSTTFANKSNEFITNKTDFSLKTLGGDHTITVQSGFFTESTGANKTVTATKNYIGSALTHISSDVTAATFKHKKGIIQGDGATPLMQIKGNSIERGLKHLSTDVSGTWRSTASFNFNLALEVIENTKEKTPSDFVDIGINATSFSTKIFTVQTIAVSLSFTLVSLSLQYLSVALDNIAVRLHAAHRKHQTMLRMTAQAQQVK